MTNQPQLYETEFVEITWKEFEERFKPIKNHLSNDPDEIMFETYGDEIEFVQKTDNRHIWTYGDGDYCSFVSSGYHYINRIGYYITEIPWEENKEYQIIISTEVECECYNEDGNENDEFGDPDCAECEGYGMITRYEE
jgi:hypothetical protein